MQAKLSRHRKCKTWIKQFNPSVLNRHSDEQISFMFSFTYKHQHTHIELINNGKEAQLRLSILSFSLSYLMSSMCVCCSVFICGCPSQPKPTLTKSNHKWPLVWKHLWDVHLFQVFDELFLLRQIPLAVVDVISLSCCSFCLFLFSSLFCSVPVALQRGGNLYCYSQWLSPHFWQRGREKTGVYISRFLFSALLGVLNLLRICVQFVISLK